MLTRLAEELQGAAATKLDHAGVAGEAALRMAAQSCLPGPDL